MSSFFAQIRKDPNMAGTVKELSDRIAQITPAIDDSEESVRLLRTDEDAIAYADTDSNALDGNRSNSDNVDQHVIPASMVNPAKKFRAPGGDFLTFHIATTATKLRDFVAGSGGFYTAESERAYANFSEASS